MNFSMYDGQFLVELDMIASVTLAAILMLFGSFVKSKLPFLQKYCIPSPVVGGMIFMLFTWLGYVTGAYSFSFVTTLQGQLMIMFFVTAGFASNLGLIKKGGKVFLILWILSGILALVQNVIGIGVARVLNIEYAYAIMASSVSMIGGHGAAAAYGHTLYEMGFENAPLVGASAATFGLISSVVIGGPLMRRLIVKYNLKPEESLPHSSLDIGEAETKTHLTFNQIAKYVMWLLICTTVGGYIARLIGTAIDMTFPAFFGAMLVAVIVRNVNEKKQFFTYDEEFNEKLGDIFLGLFLSMAMMTLRIWDLIDLAGPLLLLLAIQIIFIAAFTYFIVFKLCGKNYDAAVIGAGFIGFGLGATPTAVANMTAINEKYGVSVQALLIVPIIGGFMSGLIYHPMIVWMIGHFVG